jgi:hypothetical protein
MSPPTPRWVSLIFLFSILAHPPLAKGDDGYFSVGDLSQYTTNGVRTRLLLSIKMGRGYVSDSSRSLLPVLQDQ